MSSSNDANGGSGSGIRLPPISFLSGNQEPLRNPPTNFGISSFLNSSTNEQYKKQEEQSSGKDEKSDAEVKKLLSLQSYTGGLDVKDETASVGRKSEDETASEITTILKSNEDHSAVESGNSTEPLKTNPDAELKQKQSINVAGESNKNGNENQPVEQEYVKESTDVENKQSNTNEVTNNNVVKTIENNQNITEPKGSPVKLETGPIFEIIKEYFPNRRNLGTIIYNPTTTLQTLQTAQLVGLSPDDQRRFEEIKLNFREKISNPYYKKSKKYIPVIPQLSDSYINSLIEIKIPSRHIQMFLDSLEANGDVVKKRELWGGASGVYTDDSDILSILCHMGLFNDKIDLSEWNRTWKKEDLNSSVNNNGYEISDDLAVEVLLLPTLPQYYGYYSNGMNSRSWTGRNKHDGLSITIYNVGWETSGSYLRDPKLFKRYQVESNKQYKVSKEGLFKKNWTISQKHYKQIREKIDKLQNSTS